MTESRQADNVAAPLCTGMTIERVGESDILGLCRFYAQYLERIAIGVNAGEHTACDQIAKIWRNVLNAIIPPRVAKARKRVITGNHEISDMFGLKRRAQFIRRSRSRNIIHLVSIV